MTIGTVAQKQWWQGKPCPACTKPLTDGPYCGCVWEAFATRPVTGGTGACLMRVCTRCGAEDYRQRQHGAEDYRCLVCGNPAPEAVR